MQNAKALDERLRKIIKEVSNSTGQEIKRELIGELAGVLNENRTKELNSFLAAFKRALQKI